MSRRDPSLPLTEESARRLGYRNIFLDQDGLVYSMENAAGYRIVRNAPSYMEASLRAQSEQSS